MSYRPQVYADCVVSGYGTNVELLSEPDEDWRITLIDTGIWRNIGERLWAVREHVKDEEIFLANYSDGLTDVNLNDMVECFKKSGKLACFLAVRPPLTYHLAISKRMAGCASFARLTARKCGSTAAILCCAARFFDYMREGEELVLEPFSRLIEANQLMAYKHEGFWRCMDNLKDRQALEDMVEQGSMPWRVRTSPSAAGLVLRRSMKALPLARPGETLSVLCLGAHADDIEIGAGGTILQLDRLGVRLEVRWCVLSAIGARAEEARASAGAFLAGAVSTKIELAQFKDGFSLSWRRDQGLAGDPERR